METASGGMPTVSGCPVSVLRPLPPSLPIPHPLSLLLLNPCPFGTHGFRLSTPYAGMPAMDVYVCICICILACPSLPLARGLLLFSSSHYYQLPAVSRVSLRTPDLLGESMSDAHQSISCTSPMMSSIERYPPPSIETRGTQFSMEL